MRIKLLHLENFRKHTDTTLRFGDAPFIVIRGRNFAGKSTIGQALSLCFTPSTTGLAADGKGFVSKIKRGSSKAVITADIQGKRHLIQRMVTLHSNATRMQKSICLNDADFNPAIFDRQIEENRAALTVVLNTDAFLRMDEKEQKNLLAHLALPTRYDFDSDVVVAVGKVLGREAPNFGGEPFMVINQAYAKLFEERTIANRQVKEFVIPEPLTAPKGSSQALEEQLAELRAERRRRVEERDQAVSEATKLETDRVRVKTKIEALEEAVKKEQTRADAVRFKLVADDKLAYLRKLASGRDERDKLGKEHEQIVKLLYEDETQLAGLMEIRKDGVCPTCNQPVGKDKLAAMRPKLEARISEGREAARLLEQKIKALGDIGAAVELLAGNDRVLAELEGVKASLAEKKQQLEQEKTALPVAEEFNFQPFDKTIAECDAEIERLAMLLRPAIAAEERAKEIAIRREQLKALQEKAALLDRLVKYFDKDGIKATLLKQYVGGFENRINETMSAWGYSCSLTIDPYSFDVTNADGDTVPVRELSGAERVMFSLAFQCAVSRTANIGLVIIDEVAMFLPELRTVMNKRLYEMTTSGYLEQVVLLVADSSEQVPKLPGAMFLMVDHGNVRELKAAA